MAKAPFRPETFEDLQKAIVDAFPKLSKRLQQIAGYALDNPSELALEMAGIIDAPFAQLEARWRTSLAPTFERLDLPPLPATADPEHARTGHSDAFRWLHGEFNAVRRLDREATW